MAHKFELRIIIPAKMIGTIVELLNDEGILVSVEPYKGDGKIARKRIEPAKVYPKRSHELIWDYISTLGHAIHVDKLQEHLKMPSGTVSSGLNTLQKEGKVERTGDRGYWRVRK